MRSLLGRFHRPMSRGLVNNMLTMNNLGDGSTLSLDFTTMGGVLDPRLTFSRASTATFVNSSGYVEYAAHNLYYNTNFETITTGTSNPSLTSKGWSYVFNTGSAVFNTNGSITMTATANRIGLLRTAGFAGSGRRLIFSVDITSTGDTGVTPSQIVNEGTKTNDAYYINGILWTSGNVVGPCTLSFAFDSSTSGSASTYFGLGMSGTVTGSATFANPRWGFYGGVNQLAYSPNTSATNTNYLTAEYQAPRFDYSPTNIGEPRGLLIEGQGINVCPQSQALTTGWLNANMSTPTNPAIADPFGGTSATWKLVAPISTSALRGWRHAVVTLTAANYTFSFWAKAAEFDRIVLGDPGSGRGGCKFVLVGNGTATVIAGSTTPTNPTIELFPGGWYRCSVTMLMLASTYAMGIAGYPSATTPNEYGPTYVQTSPDGVYATGFQIELGSGASSYIPTGASQVTRNGDQVVLSNLPSMAFSQSAGTVYSQVEIMEKLRGSFIPYGSFDTSGGGRGWWWLRHNHDTSVGQRILGTAFNSVGSTGIGSSNYTHSSGVFKFATSLDTSVARMVYVINGGSAQTTTATGFTLATAAQMSINKNNDVVVTESGSMWFRTLKYWPTALPDAQLTSITS